MKKSSSKFPNEKLEIYTTKKPSTKDLYIVLLLTLLSLIILLTPLNKYIISTLSYSLTIISSFLIIFLTAYSFWAAVFPTNKFGKINRLLLTMVLGIVITTAYDLIFIQTPLDGFNINILIGLSAFIGLMIIISFLRRSRKSKIDKKEFEDENTANNLKKISSTNHNIFEDKKVDVKFDKVSTTKTEDQRQYNRKFVSFDLLLVLIATILCIYVIITPKLDDIMINTFIAIFLLLLLPGYSLVAALYPKKDDLNYIQRASLSFGFPLTVLAFGILIKNINPIAISLPFILLLIATFTLVFIIVAYIRRQRVPEIKKLKQNARPYENLHEDENQEETEYTEADSQMVNIELGNNKISLRKFVSKDLFDHIFNCFTCNYSYFKS